MTRPPDLSSDEPLRLEALRGLGLVDTPLDERFERVTRLAKRAFGVDIAAISLVEADRQFFKSIQGLDVCETSRDVSFCGHAILGDGLMIVPDARVDDRFAENPLVTGPPHITFYASMPIRSADGFKVGTLCVIDSKVRSFDAEDQQHLRDIAAMAEHSLHSAAASVIHAALIENVAAEQRRALVDPLTRMWNRTGIMNLATEAVAGACTASAGVAVIMVDLDEFKQINDTFGHRAGDEVLRVASRRMLAALREHDALGRIGGDEFLVVVSACETPDVASEIAERVRACLISEPIRTEAGDIAVSASLGVHFVLPGRTHSLGDLIETADGAMYDCKRNGRDGVRIAG